MKKRIIAVTFVNIGLVIVIFAGMELAYRWYIDRIAIFENKPYFQYDARLGWKPKPGTYDVDIDLFVSEEGYRGWHFSDFPSRLVAVVGDSCTFCSGVSDEETWPFYLSQKLDRPVLNGGVSGYGVDQAFLRMQQILAETSPELVIFAIFFDDVFRSEQSCRTHQKPYFVLRGDELVLKNSPVPPPAKIGLGDELLRHSLLLSHFVNRLQGINIAKLKVEHDQGVPVTERLLEEAWKACRRQGTDLLVVFIPGVPTAQEAVRIKKGGKAESIGSVKDMLQRLQFFCRDRGIDCLNLFEEFRKQYPLAEDREGFFIDHMNPRGNAWVADEIAKTLIGDEKQK